MEEQLEVLYHFKRLYVPKFSHIPSHGVKHETSKTNDVVKCFC